MEWSVPSMAMRMLRRDVPITRSEIVGTQLAGLVLAGAGLVVGYLYATEDAFFGERNALPTRVVGFLGLAVASLALVAGPLYIGLRRGSRGWLFGSLAVAACAFVSLTTAAT
jgi:hypothetical protein